MASIWVRVFSSRSVYWSSWGAQALHLLEVVDEGRAGFIALEVGHLLGLACQPLGLHKRLELLHRLGEPAYHHRGRVHQPDLAGAFAGLAGKERDGLVHGLLLGAEVKDVAVGLGVVEHPVGARKGLNQAVVLEVLIHVERVQIRRIKAGQQQCPPRW
ncbi:MAG: hypothetical protein KatS3mg038_0624 [Candidatus Kapaibacterium sp.]|nr:MAG: hypothetical protein KatS3mg038_0624 [Candidatus Kapabacteria bacterium]